MPAVNPAAIRLTAFVRNGPARVEEHEYIEQGYIFTMLSVNIFFALPGKTNKVVSGLKRLRGWFESEVEILRNILHNTAKLKRCQL
jgi:hypothetical protein